MSFFMGYLPIVQELKEPYYAPGVRQLWRLRSGRSRKLESVGIMLDGKNILDGYRRLGFHVIGSGGVRWFMNKTLSELFDTFLFFGPDDKTSVFTKRTKKDFSLNHITEILKETQGDDTLFLFINSSETHVPYDFGEGIYSKTVENIIQKAAPIWGCKKFYLDAVKVTKSELQVLHKAQITALESIDKKIEKLVELLKKPLLLVICGDHGECFGEGMNWGHGYPLSKVLEVPLLIAIIT